MVEPKIDWDKVPYIHENRHPSCCCTQCSVDECEWEIKHLRDYIATLEARVCEHEWFKHDPSDNMEQCRNCQLWRDEALEAKNER